MKLKSLMQPLLIAFSLLLIMFGSLLFVQQVGLAQGGGPITMTKTLNKSSNVVRVGEVLSFTIALTNNSVFTLTSVTVVDEYDTSVLAFARAIPAHDSHTPGTGVITWTNAATSPFPLLTIPPGQGITITVVFTAEHPKPTVVNKAQAQDLVHSMGMLSQTGETSKTQEAVGGSAPVFKTLQPPNSTPQAGFPVTFTHLITNDGAAIMTHLPLTDTYDPAFLQFNSAVPTPTIISPGLLVWTDLTSDFGNIPPFETVVVTTVFTALTEIVNTVNQANTAGARDQYDNDLAPGTADVPIVILPADTATPTPTPTATQPAYDNDDGGDDDDDGGAGAGAPQPVKPTATIMAAAATATVGVQVKATPTIEGRPVYLPETGLSELPSPQPTKKGVNFIPLSITILAVSLFIWIIYRQVINN